MRLSTEADRDDGRARDVIAAALAAGVVVFDTARAYALDDDDRGHNERLLARVIRDRGAEHRVHIVTKGGMTRPGGRWLVDGRARALVDDCAASRAALDGLAIDTYLLHAPDPSVPLSTSARALATLLQKGHVKSVGLSNVTRAQLDEALAIVPIAAVELQLSWFDGKALDGGVVARCVERGIRVLAHRPLGGVEKKAKLAKDAALKALAAKHGVDVGATALAAVLDLDPLITVLPGATCVDSVVSAAAADRVEFDDDDRARLAPRLDRRSVRGPRAPPLRTDGEVVLLMGLQGAGKTDALSSWLERGHVRLNRDELGGTMKGLHALLDDALAGGATRVVLDNTYTTRATRHAAIAVAWKHQLPVRGVWFDTPLKDAQVNVVLRMLATHHRLLSPAEMAKAKTPDALPPSAQHRLLKTLEVPHVDEGFAALDVVPFVRRAGSGRKGVFVDVGSVDAFFAAASVDVDDDAPVLIYGWRPDPRPDRKGPLDAIADDVRARAPRRSFTFSACTHPAGPPICWCRPPLPGLVLAFCASHDVDPTQSALYGDGPAHRGLAAAVGARFVTADS